MPRPRVDDWEQARGRQGEKQGAKKQKGMVVKVKRCAIGHSRFHASQHGHAPDPRRQISRSERHDAWTWAEAAQSPAGAKDGRSHHKVGRDVTEANQQSQRLASL